MEMGWYEWIVQAFVMDEGCGVQRAGCGDRIERSWFGKWMIIAFLVLGVSRTTPGRMTGYRSARLYSHVKSGKRNAAVSILQRYAIQCETREHDHVLRR